jgi:hypothetical protein
MNQNRSKKRLIFFCFYYNKKIERDIRDKTMDDKIIVGAIRACDTKEKLENTFALFDMNDKQRRIDIRAMYNPQIFSRLASYPLMTNMS